MYGYIGTMWEMCNASANWYRPYSQCVEADMSFVYAHVYFLCTIDNANVNNVLYISKLRRKMNGERGRGTVTHTGDAPWIQSMCFCLGCLHMSIAVLNLSLRRYFAYCLLPTRCWDWSNLLFAMKHAYYTLKPVQY